MGWPVLAVLQRTSDRPSLAAGRLIFDSITPPSFTRSRSWTCRYQEIVRAFVKHCDTAGNHPFAQNAKRAGTLSPIPWLLEGLGRPSRLSPAVLSVPIITRVLWRASRAPPVCHKQRPSPLTGSYTIGDMSNTGGTVNHLCVRHRNRTVAGKSLATKNATVQRDTLKRHDDSNERTPRTDSR